MKLEKVLEKLEELLRRWGLDLDSWILWGDYYQDPQDIEWALTNHKFYIVQTRPITAL